MNVFFTIEKKKRMDCRIFFPASAGRVSKASLTLLWDVHLRNTGEKTLSPCLAMYVFRAKKGECENTQVLSFLYSGEYVRRGRDREL